MSKHIHKLTNKNLEEKTADCSICGDVKTIRNSCENLVRTSQKTYRKNHPNRHPNIKRKRPIVKCEICKLYKTMCYDHCHKTNKFRGWIFRACNAMLGMSKDNIVTLKNAIKYLKKPQ